MNGPPFLSQRPPPCQRCSLQMLVEPPSAAQASAGRGAQGSSPRGAWEDPESPVHLAIVSVKYLAKRWSKDTEEIRNPISCGPGPCILSLCCALGCNHGRRVSLDPGPTQTVTLVSLTPFFSPRRFSIPEMETFPDSRPIHALSPSLRGAWLALLISRRFHALGEVGQGETAGEQPRLAK